MALPDFDCYVVLEVDRRARVSVISAAYKVLVKEYHPDRNPGVDARRIKRINVAYEVLVDPDKREAYDAHLEENEQQASRTQSRGRSTSRSERPKAKGSTRTNGGGLVCSRCGQTFRTVGGKEWHDVNRPRCNLGG